MFAIYIGLNKYNNKTHPMPRMIGIITTKIKSHPMPRIKQYNICRIVGLNATQNSQSQAI